MGGSEGPVGVVHEQDKKKPAPVATPVAARRRRIAGFPWESRLDFPVPFSARTYTFSFDDGGLTVLPENWNIDRDAKNKVVGYKAAPFPDANKQNYPELTYAQAKAMQDLSAKTGVSLKVAFAKVFDITSLSPAVMDKIALCPDLYAPRSQEEEVARSKKEVSDQFWAEVKK